MQQEEDEKIDHVCDTSQKMEALMNLTPAEREQFYDKLSQWKNQFKTFSQQNIGTVKEYTVALPVQGQSTRIEVKRDVWTFTVNYNHERGRHGQEFQVSGKIDDFPFLEQVESFMLSLYLTWKQ